VVYDLDGPAIKGTSEYLSVEDVAFIARHFAEWGRKQVLQEIYESKVKPVDKITAAWLDDETEVEYIRKEALLEWAKEKYEEYDRRIAGFPDDGAYWGQRNAFRQMIDKLNSI